LVKFVELNRLVQLKLGIQEKIFDLIYDNMDPNKFVLDEKSGTKKLNPKYLRHIKEFNQLKKLVANCADKMGFVDTELLLSLIDQVNLRCQMLNIEMRVGDLDIGKTEEEVFRDSLYELAKTEPSTVERQLSEEGQILDNIDEKLNNIQKTMDSFSKEVSNRFD
jgi:hypothetical protein